MESSFGQLRLTGYNYEGLLAIKEKMQGRDAFLSPLVCDEMRRVVSVSPEVSPLTSETGRSEIWTLDDIIKAQN